MHSCKLGIIGFTNSMGAFKIIATPCWLKTCLCRQTGQAGAFRGPPPASLTSGKASGNFKCTQQYLMHPAHALAIQIFQNSNNYFIWTVQSIIYIFVD
jgi:hypothetical protein